jgi:hypothetical protein
MGVKDRVFHVISNTHWDREWRFPFEKNRQMLVEMIDAVLAILDSDSTYRAFHLDSQSIVLDDYLAVRPEKKDILKRFVAERRLLIGPWYVLPDEFLVGGENLVRNLLLGHETCAPFGHVMKVGYSPFSWGQISQLPQLYAGFGVDVIMFYRGVNSLDSKQAEFIWEGADGTRSLTSRFSTMPRYNFYFYIYRPVVHNERIADVEYRWMRGGTPFHFADAEMAGEDYYVLNPVDGYFKENIVPSVEAIIKDQAHDFTTPHVLWAEGHDSSGPNPKTPRIIRDIRALMPEVNVVHSTLEDYARGLLTSAKPDELPTVRGERRSSQFDSRSGNMYAYTTSARMYLKQKNFEAEKWLQFYAEPFNAFAGMAGMPVCDNYLAMAWTTLIENSAHDSIGGCSLDEIHDDMMNRYKHVIEIAKGVFDRAAKHLVKNIDLSAHAPESIHLVAINPLQYGRNEIVEAIVDVPAELDRGAIAVTDDNGRKVRMQPITSRPADHALEQMIDRPMFFRMKRYHCLLDVREIPPFGYTTMHVKPVKKKLAVKEKKLARVRGGLRILENGHLRVTVQSNGALTVVDKSTKTTFEDLGYFYDEGEAGHAWTHRAVKPFVTTLRSKPAITIGTNGHLSASCVIRHAMKIPGNLAARMALKGMSGKNVEMPIEVNVMLRAHSRRVDFSVRVTNTAECHRLRMMFPTGIDAQHSYGEGQFDVVARPTVRPDTSAWVEQPMYDYPMHHFMDLSDGVRGAALLVSGLKEYEAMADREKTVALTLFRAFANIVQPGSLQDYSHQKGSQCPGEQSYAVSFYPHTGTWADGHVYEEALRFNNEVRLCEVGHTAGKRAATLSLLTVSPKRLIVSCVKESCSREPGTFVVRFYNPTDTAERTTVQFFAPIANAEEVTLEEKSVASLPLTSARGFTIEAGPRKLVTVRLKMVRSGGMPG